MTEVKIIAHIRTDFKTKFGLPRQSGVVPELCGVIEFTNEYKNADALRGLERYSHLWLIWGFSEGFVSRSAQSGTRQFVLQGSEETREWEFLPHAPLTVRIR